MLRRLEPRWEVSHLLHMAWGQRGSLVTSDANTAFSRFRRTRAAHERRAFPTRMGRVGAAIENSSLRSAQNSEENSFAMT